MSQRSLGIAAFIVLVGLVVVGAIYFLKPKFFEKKQMETSDAGNISTTIRFAGDNYGGYFILRSQELQKQLLAQGIRIEFTDDGANYRERLKKFADDDYDAIVLPVSSYLYHGKDHKYPGVINASISESQGADGVVGFSDKFPTGNIKELNNPNLRIVYAKESPSEFLLDLIIADFGLDQLKNSSSWRVPVASSEEAYEKLKKHEGDAFVLWEPDISRGLEIPGIKYLWGSDKFGGYIIDVFVFNRDFLKKNQDAITTFYKTYFRVIGIYANNQEKLVEEMEDMANISKSQAQTLLKKIHWFDLQENLNLQFGIATTQGVTANDGIINTILACTNVMIRTKRLEKDPLEGNPYLIVNSSILKELAKSGVVSAVAANSATVNFQPLDVEGWKQLHEVGGMRIENITFERGTNRLDEEGKKSVDEFGTLLKNNYPAFRAVVRGHTAPGGDEIENERLSRERAETVLQRLIAVHKINEYRLHAEGVGATMPPLMRTDESEREFRHRLARVEFILYESHL